MLTFNEIKAAVTKIGQKYHIKSAYLFGSYARGEAHDGSDVDIIIDDDGNIRTLLQLSRFKSELADELQTDVDVLTADGIRPQFFDLIKNDQVVLYGI